MLRCLAVIIKRDMHISIGNKLISGLRVVLVDTLIGAANNAMSTTSLVVNMDVSQSSLLDPSSSDGQF